MVENKQGKGELKAVCKEISIQVSSHYSGKPELK